MHTSAPLGLSEIANDFHNVCVYIASKYVHLSYATQINKYTKAGVKNARRRMRGAENKTFFPIFPATRTYLSFLFFLSSSLIEGLLIQHHIIYFVDPVNAIKFAAAAAGVHIYSHICSPHSFCLFIYRWKRIAWCVHTKNKIDNSEILFFSDAGGMKEAKQQHGGNFSQFSFLIIFLFIRRGSFYTDLKRGLGSGELSGNLITPRRKKVKMYEFQINLPFRPSIPYVSPVWRFKVIYGTEWTVVVLEFIFAAFHFFHPLLKETMKEMKKHEWYKCYKFYCESFY